MRSKRHASLTIGALSRATGVPIATLRSWEQRYGAPKAERRPSGHRLYSLDEVERVRFASALIRAGHRASQVVGADAGTLNRLAAVGSPASAKAALHALDAAALLRALEAMARSRPPAQIVREWRKKLPLATAHPKDRLRAAFLDARTAEALATLRRPVASQAPRVVVLSSPGARAQALLLSVELELLGGHAIDVDAGLDQKAIRSVVGATVVEGTSKVAASLILERARKVAGSSGKSTSSAPGRPGARARSSSRTPSKPRRSSRRPTFGSG